MNVRRLRKKKHLEAPAHWSARATETILASDCLNVNTCVAFLVPPIILATRNVHKRVDNVVFIAHAISHAGNLVLRVWNHVNGSVPTTHARWCVAR